MKHLEELLSAWHSRTRPGDAEQFSTQARQRIAALFLEVSACSGDNNSNGAKPPDLDELSTEIAELGADAGLAPPLLCAELRNCQLSLFGVLASNAVRDETQQSGNQQLAVMQTLLSLLQSLDDLITHSAGKFDESEDTPGGSRTIPGTNGKQGKTLQHEIRTPLQGALLTTELMLEDAGHGDPVSADDILAVRKSIETAVGILNEFASRSTPD